MAPWGASRMTKILTDILAAILHRLPIWSGLTALSFNSVVHRLMADVPRAAPARLRDGNWIDVTTTDYHGRVLYLFGTNDPKLEHAAHSLLTPTHIVSEI